MHLFVSFREMTGYIGSVEDPGARPAPPSALVAVMRIGWFIPLEHIIQQLIVGYVWKTERHFMSYCSESHFISYCICLENRHFMSYCNESHFISYCIESNFISYSKTSLQGTPQYVPWSDVLLYVRTWKVAYQHRVLYKLWDIFRVIVKLAYIQTMGLLNITWTNM